MTSKTWEVGERVIVEGPSLSRSYRSTIRRVTKRFVETGHGRFDHRGHELRKSAFISSSSVLLKWDNEKARRIGLYQAAEAIGALSEDLRRSVCQDNSIVPKTLDVDSLLRLCRAFQEAVSSMVPGVSR